MFACKKAALAYDDVTLAALNPELAYAAADAAASLATLSVAEPVDNVFAKENAELAYEPDVTALASAVLAAVKAPLAYTEPEFAV